MEEPANDDEFGKYRDYLVNLARARISFDLRGRIDPSDVVQETLCQVLAGQPRERTDGQMMGWLRLKLHDNLVERFRRHRLDRHIVSLDRLLDQTSRGMSRFMWASQSGPDARLIRVEDARKLADRLAKLSNAQAEAIVLKHCEGMSVKEICRHMNKTPEAVGGLLKHGMRKLRELLSQDA